MTDPELIAESVAPWKDGDLVTDPETSMVGRVVSWWLDDGGQWLNIEWFPSTMRGDEVVEPTPEDRRTHEQ